MTRADHRKHHIIYKTTCLVTGKWYIGMHSTNDLMDGYVGSGQRLWKSIKKHGKEQHRCEVLEHLPDRKALAEREEALVAEAKKDPLCMNIAQGGVGHQPGAYRTAEETKRILSEKSKALWARRRAEGYVPPPQSPASVEKRAASNTGKRRTKEQKANLLAGQLQYYDNVDPAVLKERGQKILATKLSRGTVRGGRPRSPK